MNELPVLVLELICEYLSYEDRLSLKATCKALKQFVSEKVFEKVNVFVKQNPQHVELFFTNRMVCYANSLRIDDIRHLSSVKFRTQFDQVQQMIIRSDHANHRRGFVLNLNDLNHFVELRHLQIKEGRLEGKLSLKHLEVASFSNRTFVWKSRFELDCPGIKALALLFELEATLVGDTNNLTHLLYHAFPDSEDYLPNLCRQLKNLSVVRFERIADLSMFLTELNTGRFCLLSLVKIKLENFVTFATYEDDDENGGNSFEELDNVVEQLSILKRNSCTKHIEFYLNDHRMSAEQLVELSNIIRQPDIDGDNNSMDSRRLNILEKSAICDCLFPGPFSTVLDENSKFREAMIRKLRRTFHLHIENKFEIDQPLFEHLLDTWRFIRQLEFKNVYLKPERLEMIAKHLLSVKTIHLRDDKIEGLNFLTKFSNLNSIVFLYNLEKEKLKWLLYQDRLLNKIEIYGKYQHISFEKDDKFWVILAKRNLERDFLQGESELYQYWAEGLDKIIDWFYRRNVFEVDFIDLHYK